MCVTNYKYKYTLLSSYLYLNQLLIKHRSVSRWEQSTWRYSCCVPQTQLSFCCDSAAGYLKKGLTGNNVSFCVCVCVFVCVRARCLQARGNFRSQHTLRPHTNCCSYGANSAILSYRINSPEQSPKRPRADDVQPDYGLKCSRSNWCHYLHAVVEELPHGSDAAVGPLVFGQPPPGVDNVLGMHKDVRRRPAERLHHKRGQPTRSHTHTQRHTHTHTQRFLRKQFLLSVPVLVTPEWTQLQDNYITASCLTPQLHPQLMSYSCEQNTDSCSSESLASAKLNVHIPRTHKLLGDHARSHIYRLNGVKALNILKPLLKYLKLH